MSKYPQYTTNISCTLHPNSKIVNYLLIKDMPHLLLADPTMLKGSGSSNPTLLQLPEPNPKSLTMMMVHAYYLYNIDLLTLLAFDIALEILDYSGLHQRFLHNYFSIYRCWKEIDSLQLIYEDFL